MIAEEKKLAESLLCRPFPPFSGLLPEESGEDGEKIQISGVTAFLFRGSGKERTVILNAHGGGFLKGRSIRDAVWCRYAAAHTGCDVYDLDYALTPDYCFPAAVEQLSSAAKELAGGHRIILAGHSAGANLALSAAMFYGVRPAGILADYPPVDAAKDFFAGVPEEKLERARVEKLYFDLYCGDADPEDPRISVKYAARKDVERLPQTLFIVGELDSLRDEVVSFAEFCDKECRVFRDSPHGFTTNRYGAWKEALDCQMSFLCRIIGDNR